MEYYVSFDGGGTKLDAVLFDGSGRVLSAARTGGVNHSSGTAATRIENITACVDRLFEGAGEPVPAVTAVYGQIFGDARDYTDAVARHCPCGEMRWCGEGSLGVLSCGEADGIMALSGTGSNTFYVRGGETVRTSGGWGYAFDDLGSGYDIGRAAMQYVRRVVDHGLPVTPLFTAVTDHFGTTDMQVLIHTIYADRAPARVLAALVPVVERAADEGDPAAQEILRKAGEALADETEALMRACNVPDGMPVCLTGGVLDACRPVRAAFEAALRKTHPAVRFARLRMPPVYGGILYHFVHSGQPLTAERVEYVSQQAHQTAVATA